MADSAQTLPYAAAPPSAGARALLLPLLGWFAMVLGLLRLAALALLVGWPLIFRAAPLERTVPGRSFTPAPGRLIGAAAEAAGAALLISGGVACVRRQPAGRLLILWAAGVLVLGVAWGAGNHLFVLLRISPLMQWPVAVLAVGQAAAWEAAFPALLWALCRRAR